VQRTCLDLLNALQHAQQDREAGSGVREVLVGREAWGVGRHAPRSTDHAPRLADPRPLTSTASACQVLASASYVQAICWIGACLADALNYARERGMVHLDVKPSNVLLAADGQPMLLDFHLASAPMPAGTPAPAWLGGTPAYMAPEHDLALAAVRNKQMIAVTVDGQADIYSLGLLLYESLGGLRPVPTSRLGRELRQRNPHVTKGLADLLGKCLAPVPQNRYPTAGSLAADLRRHLADLPLRGVRNRSISERWWKWRRRRPSLLPLFFLIVALSGAAAVGIVHGNKRL